jgi:hypothetical protein
MNIRDMAFKLFWTLLNAGLAYAIVEVANLDPAPAWGGILLVGLQAASTWVRQYTGATPVDAPVVGPIGQLTK